jgi:hypothetical protein
MNFIVKMLNEQNVTFIGRAEGWRHDLGCEYRILPDCFLR